MTRRERVVGQLSRQPLGPVKLEVRLRERLRNHQFDDGDYGLIKMAVAEWLAAQAQEQYVGTPRSGLLKRGLQQLAIDLRDGRA